MSYLIAAALLQAAAGTPAHSVQIDHNGQPVDVTYRSDVSVTHRQVGAAGAPGRPNTLRCTWKAAIDVHREARHPGGLTMARTISADTPVSGSRNGWCATQRDAIAADVAQRSGAIRDHLLAVAAEDHQTLRAELDARGPTRS